MGICNLKKEIFRNNISSSSLPHNGIQPIGLKCKEGFLLTKMCINRACQKFDCLTCDHATCPECSNQHKSCSWLKLKSVISLLEKRQNQSQQFIKRMDEIQANLVQTLNIRRHLYVENMFKKGFDQNYLSIANNIVLLKGQKSLFNGRQAEQFYQKLVKSNSQMTKNETQVLNLFSRQIQTIAVQLTNLQGKAIQKYIKMCKIQKNLIQPKSQIVNVKFTNLDSLIIPPEKEEDIQFIYQSLNSPKEIKLIFRASQNEFSAFKFHQKCDNTPHTLTLIKTQYNRIIAGYTPLTWNMTKGIAADYSEQSFLLSVDLKEKMSLINKEKAIQCNSKHGPIFGGGSDLGITHLCNQNKQSWINFPYSYNSQGKYRFDQRAWTALCGAEEGRKFSILQYEVYKVSWLL